MIQKEDSILAISQDKADEIHESSEIFRNTIFKLVTELLPMELTIDARYLTGTPPYQQNCIKEYIADIDVVVLVVTNSYSDDTGMYYTVAVGDTNRNLICQDITIRDWHLIHYIQKSSSFHHVDIIVEEK